MRRGIEVEERSREIDEEMPAEVAIDVLSSAIDGLREGDWKVEGDLRKLRDEQGAVDGQATDIKEVGVSANGRRNARGIAGCAGVVLRAPADGDVRELQTWADWRQWCRCCAC